MKRPSSTAYGYSREELIGKGDLGPLCPKRLIYREKALFRRCINGEILKNIEGERIQERRQPGFPISLRSPC